MKSQLLINDIFDTSSSKQMQERIKLLEKENQQPKKKVGHNDRGVGCTSPYRSTIIQQVKKLLHLEDSEKEIMKKL